MNLGVRPASPVPQPEIDWPRRSLRVGEVSIRLEGLEFELAAFLAHRPGIIRERAELQDYLGMGPEISDRAVDSVVKRLRRRFRAVLGDRELILAYRGVGYYWRDD